MNLESAGQTQPPVRHGRLAFFWAVLGALSTLAVFPYLSALYASLFAHLPIPLPLLALAQTAQTGLLLFLLSWLGLRLGQSVGLDSPFARAFVYGFKGPTVSRRAPAIASLTGVVAGGVLLALDRLFQPFVPPPPPSIGGHIDLWKRLLASFYGGCTEELLVRLFFMTLVVWVIWKTVLKGKVPPTPAAFWSAILVASLLFGAGHLPAAAHLWPLTPAVVVRIMALNMLGGIAFGFLYWRMGLEFAMLAHFCSDVVLHGVGGT